MPALCQPLFEAIPRLREQNTLLQNPRSALLAVRSELGSVVEGLSDTSLEALLEYAEQCGEIILSRETVGERDKRLAIIIWDPNWFATAILGEFFQPAVWRRTLLRNVRMQRHDVVACLRDIVSSDGRVHANDELLNRVLGVLQQMRLCIPIGSGGEEWFPSFLNSAEEHEGFREAEESLQREDCPASELLERYLQVAHNDEKRPSVWIRGRCLLLTDRSGRGVTLDD
eukprot:scaffold7910_cov372-Pinguiococcus_pyrenoidosus.AAC.1